MSDIELSQKIAKAAVNKISFLLFFSIKKYDFSRCFKSLRKFCHSIQSDNDNNEKKETTQRFSISILLRLFNIILLLQIKITLLYTFV